MNNSTESKPKNNLALKIIIPVLLVVVVAGIWAAKNAQQKETSNNDSAIVQTDAQGNTQTNSNPDFAYDVKDDFNVEKLKSYGLPIIIEFGADWCAPCKQMKPIVTALNKDLVGRAIIRYVDTDKYGSLLSDYNFQYIPTQLFINADGTPYSPANAAKIQMDLHYDSVTNELDYTTHTGTLTKQELLDILDEMGMK